MAMFMKTTKAVFRRQLVPSSTSLLSQRSSITDEVAYFQFCRLKRCSRWSTSLRPKTSYALEYGDIGSSSSISQQAIKIDAEDGETKTSIGGVWNDCSIAINENGIVITIANGCDSSNRVVEVDNGVADKSAIGTNSWEFSSVLLWVNDPQYIHASSGQRIRSLGQFSRDFAIISVEVMCISCDESSVAKNNIDSGIDSSVRNLHPIPVKGSMHSRGGIYRTALEGSCTSHLNRSRTLIKVKWNYGEDSIFDLDWLVDLARNNCLGRWIPNYPKNLCRESDSIANESLRKKTEIRMTARTTAVTKEIAIGGVTMASFDYRDLMKNEDTLFAGMQEIFEHGAILVHSAQNLEEDQALDETSSTPSLESIVGNLGRRFSGGNLSHGSLYGDMFHVKSNNDAKNIAYTNLALPPHQDLAYYESKPFLQLLHCVTDTNDGSGDRTPDLETEKFVVGGESVLIDGMAAAEELRRVAPDLFDILCQTDATFVKERHDVDMVSPKPHIVLDSAHGQVVEFNWSPPFEGPLQMHPRIAVDDYVRAYQAIECMIDDNLVVGNGSEISDRSHSTLLPKHLENLLRDYAKQYTWEYALQKGDILVFNNQRMLHGRRSFRCFGKFKRHLIGCYTDSMDTVSQYRKLMRDRTGKISEGNFGKRNPGSGYRWI